MCFIIIISTLVVLLFIGLAVRYIFLNQEKKFLHAQEMVALHDSFEQELLQSRLKIQEQTLNHIAKELHSNITHLVSLININLAELLPQNTGETKENIKETKVFAKLLMSELKDLSVSLNTDHIQRIGFVRALQNELSRMGRRKKYEIFFSQTGEEFILPDGHDIILLRLCQDVLNNIMHYAKASSITASLSYSSAGLEVAISDNGIGFDPEQIRPVDGEKESTGLLNIRSRARAINAGVKIESRTGEGTSVIFSIPAPSNT